MSRLLAPLVGLALVTGVPAVAQAQAEPDPLPGVPAGIVVHPGADAKPCADPCRRTHRADVAGDGRAEIVTTSAGTAPTIVIRDPRSGRVLETIHPFGTHYHGHGVQFALGDVDGDGTDEIVVAAGAGAAPRVRVFDGATGAAVGDFFAFEPGFTGGVNVAVGDVDGDGVEDIVVGAGRGGGPDVRVFDGHGQMSADFFAFDPSYRGGVTVAVD
jgi:hypothetical protein